MNLPSPPSNNYDVVIIGAGAVGCSIAYSLAKKSNRKMSIAVIDKKAPGEEASSGAAGMLAAQVESESAGPFLDLAMESRELFESLSWELKELTGVDIEFKRSGIASIAYDPDHEHELKSRFGWQKEAGLECEWLSSAEISSKFPFLKQTDFGGFWSPLDGQVSANRLTAAFAEGARKHGVTFIENKEVRNVIPAQAGIQTNNKRLDFVLAGDLKIFAEKFIFAGGSWTGKILKGKVPVVPVKGQILIFDLSGASEKYLSWESPVFIGKTKGDFPISCYFTPKGDRHLYLGATVESCGFDRSENEGASGKMADYAGGILPGIFTFPFKGVWTGFRPGSPDRLPILGLVPGFENVFVASGHFRNGILLSPVTGKIFSDALLGSDNSRFPPAFSPMRFTPFVV